MRADVFENTLPGAEPGKITSPFVMWIAAVLAGPIFGGYWLYRNAKYLGCRDLKQQGVVLLVAAVLSVPALGLIDIVRDMTEPESLGRLGTIMAFNLVLLIAITATGYCYTRQVKLFGLHASELGKKPLNLSRTALLVVAAWVVTFILLAVVPPLGEAMGGLAYYIS